MEEEEKFQQVVYMNYKFEEFIYLLDVMNSVFDKFITNQPICNVPGKEFHLLILYQYFFYSSQEELEHWK